MVGDRCDWGMGECGEPAKWIAIQPAGLSGGPVLHPTCDNHRRTAASYYWTILPHPSNRTVNNGG
mgnify:CR=1 FL=1